MTHKWDPKSYYQLDFRASFITKLNGIETL